MRDEAAWMRIVRANWHLLIVLALILVGTVVLASRPKPTVTADAAVKLQVETQTTLQSPAAPEKSRWAKPTRSEKVQEAIDTYTHEVDYNVGSVDTPHNLFRLANLYYSELQDYDKASLYYMTLLQDYPDYQSMQTVFVNLVTCYERLGRNEMERNTLDQMMKFFGEGTQEYLFAEQKLAKM